MKFYHFAEDLLNVKENMQLLGRVNKLRIPEDLLMSNATLINVLHVKGGDVHVQEELIVNGLLNNVLLSPLFDFTLNENQYMEANLKVQGESL